MKKDIKICYEGKEHECEWKKKDKNKKVVESRFFLKCCYK